MRAQIKDDSNLVITHCPTYFESELRLRILQVKPVLHIFGHDHDSFDIQTKQRPLQSTLGVNVSVQGPKRNLRNSPTYIVWKRCSEQGRQKDVCQVVESF